MVIPVKTRAKAGIKVFLSYPVLLDFLTICHKFCQEILICQETTDNILYVLFDPRFFNSLTKIYREHDWTGPNTGCFTRRWSLLGAKKSAPKRLKNIFFFQDNFYLLKAHAHYFTVLIYLATWRAAKLGIFTHFMFTNLPRCSQSINSLIYTDPQLLFMSAWSQSWSHFFWLPPPKNNVCITPCWV